MGFSAAWLDLREPADRAARDPHLLRRAAGAAGANPVILDLGCGSGATLRAMAPHLCDGARWRLVDSDPTLLDHAASAARATGTTHEIDLSDLDALPLEGVAMVTASALLDLVSEAWLQGLVDRVRVPFYAALTYDGQMHWTPPDDTDAPVTEAFNRHQRRDKGFGPALGPDAARVAADLFRQAGFQVFEADSPWAIGPEQATLHRDLLAGIALAASQTGLSGAETWGARRAASIDEAVCHIGHRDLLALPPCEQPESARAAD